MSKSEVRILSVELPNDPGYSKSWATDRRDRVVELQKQVNDLLHEHPHATIEWFQSSAGAGGSGSFTQLTAVIRWSFT